LNLVKLAGKAEVMIFDLDGTLVDSVGQIEISLEKARVKLGHPSTPTGLVQQQLGLPVEYLFSDLRLEPSDLQNLVQSFRENLLIEIKKENLIFEGVLSFLQKIKFLNIPIGVATTKPTYLAKEVIANSDLKDMVNFVQGTDEFSPKPDPEVLRRCMQGLGAKSAVMFGDRIEDIQAAKLLGLPSIGIAHSAHSVDSLLAKGAKYAFKNFMELDLKFDQIIQLVNVE